MKTCNAYGRHVEIAFSEDGCPIWAMTENLRMMEYESIQIIKAVESFRDEVRRWASRLEPMRRSSKEK